MRVLPERIFVMLPWRFVVVVHRVFLERGNAFAATYPFAAAEVYNLNTLYRNEYILWEENQRYSFYQENEFDADEHPEAWVDDDGFVHPYPYESAPSSSSSSSSPSSS